MIDIPWFENKDIINFPDPAQAKEGPDGLLALGGNLSVKTLVKAYEEGVFPWFTDDQPILWWSPSMRAIINTDKVHVSKSMRKLIKKQKHSVTFDKHFEAVVCACSRPSQNNKATWVTRAMKKAYFNLFKAGYAHSVEIWSERDVLVGGLYGVFIRNSFCGESMFSTESNTSKLALISLAKFLNDFGCQMIDCQLSTEHLASLGVETVSRKNFLSQHKSNKTNIFLEKQSWERLWQQSLA